MPNKRIRKKKHLGEFAILGFKVTADEVSLASSDDDIWMKLDSVGFLCAGKISKTALDMVVWLCDGCDDHKFRQTNAQDQEWVRDALLELGAQNIQVGKLRDINSVLLWR